MYSLNRLLISLILLLLSGNLSGQINLDLKSTRFSEEDGLSNNIVYTIVEDHNGLMWIGTSNGLNRFDGHTFKVFRKNYTDSNSVVNNIVYRLAVDRFNNLWIGYGVEGLSCYNQRTRTFKHYMPDSTESNAILPGQVDGILIDKEGLIYVGIARKGLMVFNPTTEKFTWLGYLPYVSKERSWNGQLHYNRITKMFFDKAGIIWMATGDGLYTYNPAKKKFEVYRFDKGPENIKAWKRDVFNTICQLNDTSIYLGGWGTGVNYFNTRTRQWKTYHLNTVFTQRGTSNIINDLERKSEYELWVASNDTSLCIFNTKEEKFYFISSTRLSEAQLTEKGVISFYSDKSGDLWIGHQKGFNFLNRSKPEFTFIPHLVTSSDNQDYYGISSVFEDSISGKTLISTAYADGFNIIDKHGKTTHHTIELLPDQEPFQILGKIFNDRNNNLWVLSRDFLYQYDRENDKLIKPLQPVPDSSIKGGPFYWNIIEDKLGNLWIATHRHGIYVFNPVTKTYKQLFYQPGNLQSPRSNIITGLGIDPLGMVWIGYKLDGISRYDPATGEYIHFKHLNNDPQSIIDNQILTLHLDQKGIVWLGSFAGLSKIDSRKPPFKVDNFIKGQQLLGIVVVDIESDNLGNIWFTNTTGLTMLNPTTLEIKAYNHSNGLPGTNQNLSIYHGPKNDLILTSYAGYYRFFPDQIHQLQKPGRVQVTSLISGEKDINYDYEIANEGEIRLKPEDNFFTIEFASLNYKNPTSLVYSYRLRGLDKSWKTSNRVGTASFTHLPGGNYVFEVRASNPTGMWSDTTSIPIYIATPFYKTNWFTAILAIVIASVIYFLYRMRIRNIEKTESLKTQFNKQLAETEMRALRAQMNPHFIFNCLNSINRYIVKNDHKTASLYLTKFAKLIRLILDNSETHQVSLNQELDALKLYIDIESLRFDHKFSYEIEVDENIQTDSILIPPMIIQPFVENAIWHGLLHKDTPGRMHLRFFLEGDLLYCEVEDDGVGRRKAMELKSKSATTRKSLGIKITSDRLAILNSKSNIQGSITYEDLNDHEMKSTGTRVTIKIPVDID